MTDYSRDRLGPDDEDRLPWLEPVEEEMDEDGVSTGRLLIWAAAAILLIGIALGSYLWLRGSDRAPAGEGALIKAPDAYYKERPAEEKTAVSGGDEVVYSASKGNEVESMIDTNGAAETPVNVDRAAAPAAPPAAAPAANAKPVATAKQVTAAPAPANPKAPPAAAPPKAQVKEAKPAKPKPAPEAQPLTDGTMIQLGAFSSESKANGAWKNLAARFSFLTGLNHSVVPVQSGDKTLYRLRASGGSGRDICGRLRTAGESCSVVG